MSYLGNTPGVSSQRTVLEEVVTGSPKSAFVPQGGYIKGYVDVLVNGTELDTSDFTAADGITITLTVAAAVGDTVKVKAWLPRGLSDGYLKSEADDRFAALVSGNIIVPANSGGSRVIGAASSSNTTVVLQAGAASGSGANIELTKEGTIFNDASTHKFRSLDGGTEYATINGNGLVLPAGKGIDFSANSNASGMAGELLDDYEYGAWTPRLSGSGGGVYAMGGVNSGRYLKVGRKVIAWASMQWVGQTTGFSGNLAVFDLPFVNAGVRAVGSMGAVSAGLTFSSGYTRWTYLMDPGYTFAYIIQDAANGTGYSHSPTVATTGLVYGLTICYEAA